MNEFIRFQNLVSKLKDDKTFRNRNISEVVKLVPFIGGIIEANTIGKDCDEKLEQRLLELEEIAIKAISKDDFDELVNVLEQHTLVLNKFVFEFKDTLFKETTISIKKVQVGISFVEKDFILASKIVKQLKESQIDVISNNFKLVEELQITYNKELTPNSEALIIIYTQNYERYNTSSYSKETLLNNAILKKIPVFTFAFDNLKETKLPIENTFQKVFNRKNIEDIVPTFFFDKYLELKEVEHELYKKYSDVETILKLYNSNFKKIRENDKNDMGYEEYELKQLTGSSIFCLYLYENINLKKTIETIKDIHSGIDFSKDLFVLINRNKKQDENKRIHRIKSFIGIQTKVFFIDDFVWKELTSHFFDETKIVENTTYVQPFFMYQGKKFDNFNFFENWLYKNNSPTLIITGSGGIGKTTLSTILTDRINNSDENTKAIYIDALKISSTILNLSHNDSNIDLYAFYEASLPKNNLGNKIDYELFRINVDNGNIVIIIDGLDEIISRLGDLFDVECFFNSIQEFSKGIGNGKVILTSRNYFWNKLKSPDFNIQTLEILPFDKNKAEEFFKKRYPNSPKIPARAISISESIIGKNSIEYIPYVLECVAFIIDDTVENGEYYDPDFNSDTLNQNIKNDFILGKLCVREEQRTEQVSVDNQLKLFFEVALNNITKSEFKNVCSRILDDSINDRQSETFLAHPIIEVKKECIVFKYDFFKSHIKNIYFNLLIIGEYDLNNHHIDIMSNYISYNSSFTNDLCERIQLSDDELMFRILELIDILKNRSDLTKDIIRRSISSLFIITLKIIHKRGNRDVETNTSILKQIFESTKDKLKDVYLIDLSCNDSNKIIFDFSNLDIADAYIKSYDYFWNCKFNENTRFNESYFYNVFLDRNYNTTAKPEFFINVKGSDDSFKNVVKKVVSRTEDKDIKIILDIHQFFSCFCNNGNIERRILPKIAKQYQRNIVSLDILIKVLAKEDIIKQYRSPTGVETIEICADFNEDILKFHSNRLTVGIIKPLFIKIKEKIK